MSETQTNLEEFPLLHGRHSGFHVDDEDDHRQYSLCDLHELRPDAHSQDHGYDCDYIFHYIHWDSDRTPQASARPHGPDGYDASVHRGDNRSDPRA